MIRDERPRLKSLYQKHGALALREAVLDKVNQFVIDGAASISLDCLIDLGDDGEDISIREALEAIIGAHIMTIETRNEPRCLVREPAARRLP